MGDQRNGVDDAPECRVLGADQAGQRRLLVVPRRFVQGTRTALVQGAQRGQYAVVLQPGVLGDLLGGGRAATEPLLQFLDRLEDPAARLLKGTGQPHGGGAVAPVPPELTRHLGKRVREEGVPQTGIVAVDGLDQADGRDLNEVVGVLPGAVEATRDTAGQRQEQADHLVPQGGPPWTGRLLREITHQCVETG